MGFDAWQCRKSTVKPGSLHASLLAATLLGFIRAFDRLSASGCRGRGGHQATITLLLLSTWFINSLPAPAQQL